MSVMGSSFVSRLHLEKLKRVVSQAHFVKVGLACKTRFEHKLQQRDVHIWLFWSHAYFHIGLVNDVWIQDFTSLVSSLLHSQLSLLACTVSARGWEQG